MTREGFGQAYQKGYELTVRFLLSRGVKRDSADEVAQAAWVRGWERREQLRNESLVVTWVNTIALNVYRSFIRREFLNESFADSVDKTVSINVAAMDVKTVLRMCRPNDRRLLEASMRGLSTKEIARQQGTSETAIRIRLLRARRDARSRLEAKPIRIREDQAFAMNKYKAA
jgi:RNA polymerase sigma-70 factor (ECF subfamily)